jgi:hypothetical protein
MIYGVFSCPFGLVASFLAAMFTLPFNPQFTLSATVAMVAFSVKWPHAPVLTEVLVISGDGL